MSAINLNDPENFMHKKNKKIMYEIIDLLKEKKLSVIEASHILDSTKTKIEILANHRKL